MDYIDYDQKHIWHPYTSIKNPTKTHLVEQADGVYIELSGGEKLIDGMSSWWSTIHGYNNPILNNAINEQCQKMAHVMFGGLTHKPAIELSKKLIDITPKNLQHVFLADSGSISVEVALKMALQYQHCKNQTHRTKFLTPLGGYHGDTWHCMSVCDPQGGMHTLWNGRLPQQIFAPRPTTRFHEKWDENNADSKSLIALFEEHGATLAAVILEPIVQGAGGMHIYNPQYLKLIKKLCTKYDVLLIADEIATGFGRTGKMFAVEHAQIEPDIMCVGKALTGGYMTLAAVLCSSEIAMKIDTSLMHGPTFMGNPLACAVAAASLDIINQTPLLERVKNIETILLEELTIAIENERVQDVRVLGAIGVIEMKENVNMAEITAKAIEKGIWIRPFGKLVYAMPQYIITDEELRYLCRSIVEII